MGGEKVVSSHIVRGANRKSPYQIHNEIRLAQRQKVTVAAPVTALPRWVWLAARLPGFIRRIFLRRMLANPFVIREMGGTVNLTSIGMVAKGGGWGIAIAEMSLNVAVGGIEQKARVIDGQICVREMLSLTLSFDHDVIDGAPAARFATRMKQLIESARGLDQLDSAPAPVPAESAIG